MTGSFMCSLLWSVQRSKVSAPARMPAKKEAAAEALGAVDDDSPSSGFSLGLMSRCGCFQPGLLTVHKAKRSEAALLRIISGCL